MLNFIKSFFVTINYVAIDLITNIYCEETDQLIKQVVSSNIVIGSAIDVSAFVKGAEFEEDIAEIYCCLTNKEIRRDILMNRELRKEAKRLFPNDDIFLAAFKLYVKKHYILFNVDNVSIINMID